MHLTDLLGRVAPLLLTRVGRDESLLAPSADPGAPRLLIATAELPAGAAVGDTVDAYVFQDAHGDPVASVTPPRLSRGEVTFLQVTGVTPYGLFVDWGYPKDLFVHQQEQTRPVRVGERHPVGLIVDDRGRLTGTMKVRELVRDPINLPLDAWMPGEAWRQEDGIGLFVILQRRWVGLLPKQEPHRLRYGESTAFRIADVKPDGRVVLSLRAKVAEQIDDDAERVLAYLQRPRATPVTEAWPPEKVAQVFGLSKKAFKRAIGRLFRDGVVEIAENGDVTLR